MADFGIRFFLCNLIICMITAALLAAKRICRHILTSRMQFHLWYLLLALLTVPFLPVRPAGLLQILSWFAAVRHSGEAGTDPVQGTAAGIHLPGTLRQMDDLTLSVSGAAPSIAGFILCSIWLTGVIAMLFIVIRSSVRLTALRRSALPLQSRTVRALYDDCLRELHIKRPVPVYSAAYLKSPLIMGICRPRIYLPLHLISDFDAKEMRYILLHELQHYRHKDTLAGLFMTLTGILYWCNPLVRYALKEMRSDREIACDAAVLKRLPESDYEAYGTALINFAEKVSHMPFPFAAGMSGSMKQMRQRIAAISTYEKPDAFRKAKGCTAFALIGALLLTPAPLLSTRAAGQEQYRWNPSPDRISRLDLSSYFDGYEGSFVLYDLKNDHWHIYDMEHALLRTSPDSTYKIYDALFALEEGVITPADSSMAWDGTAYPFAAWNKDQNLDTAMRASVNWYFEKLDRQLGSPVIWDYLHRIGYGNETIPADITAGSSPYWLQSSLKISPVEQVQLLAALYDNRPGFAPEHVTAVKDSIRLYSTADTSPENTSAGNASAAGTSPENASAGNTSAGNTAFYGKTGTGRVDGQDRNGWFIGFFEVPGNTCFFAVNIQGSSGAAGSRAAGIAKAVLSALAGSDSSFSSTELDRYLNVPSANG